MPYPQTILTKPLRRVIMTCLIGLFFTVSPLVILYTAGYRYNFGTKTVEETGVISIDARPREAEVYVNGNKITNRMPIRLSNMAPGTYDISIRLAGKKTWHYQAIVNSKQTTYIRNIELFSEALPIEIFQDPSAYIAQVDFSYDGLYAMLTQKLSSETYTLTLFNLQSMTSEQLYGDLTQIPTISWSPFFNRALILLTQGNTYTARYFDPATPATLQSFTVTDPETFSYQWDTAADLARIFIQDARGITSLTNTQETLIRTSTTQSPWFIDESGTFWEYTDTTRTIRSTQGSYTLDSNIDTIASINEHRIIGFDDEETRTFEITDESTLTAHSAPGGGVWFEPSTEEWLTWSPWELTSIYPDGNTQVLNRTSDAIATVRPLDDYGLLLLATQDRLLGFNPGYYITDELYSNGVIRSVGVHQESKKIYFWGKVGSKEGIFELAY